MKKRLQSGLCLVVVGMMLISMVPASVLAEETDAANETSVNQESFSAGSNETDSANSPPHEIISENGQNMIMNDSNGEIQTKTTEPQSIGEEKEDTSQNEAVTDEPQINTAESDFGYTDIEGGVSISHYNGPGGDLKLPSTLDGKIVMAIGENAFYDCDSITSIVIPKSIVSIGLSAFSDCNNLRKVVIPSNVKNIGEDVFKGSDQVMIFEFEGSEAEKYAKSNDLKISEVTHSNNTLYEFKEVDGGVSITAYNGSGGNVVVPSTLDGKKVMEIGDGAFGGCASITSISLPESVTSIGDYVFWGCSSLMGIIVETGNLNYKSIGGVLFDKAGTILIACPSGKTSISIPGSVANIGDGAFHGCSSLTSISLPGSVTSIGVCAFYGCSSLTSISIPRSVTNIRDGAFYGCSSLTSISLPGRVTSIGDYAFLECSSLTSISLPMSVTSIGEAAFYGCSSLTSISLPEGLTSIGGYAFYGCSSITSISLPEGLTSIGGYTFYGCSSITSISLPEGLTSIGSYTFAGCSSLKSVSIPGGVTSIGEAAFSRCSGLTSITIPESVLNIDYYAFSGCTGLTSITIPDSVTTIGEDAFNYCDNLSIYGVIGSYAQIYANANSIPFVSTATIAPSIKNFTVDKASGQYVNTSIKLTAAGTGGKLPYQYKFYYKLGTTTTVIQDFSATTSATFKPITAGSYTLYVQIKDAAGKTATKMISNYLVYETLSVKSFAADKASGQNINTSIKLTAAGAGGKTPYLYKFYYKLGTVTTTIQDYSATASATFKPTKVGTYTLCVDVKDAGGKVATKSIANYTVVNNPIVKTFTTDKATGQYVNTAINLNATGTAGTPAYQYKFYYKLGTTTVVLKDFSTANMATFKPTTAGTYTLYVQIKDAAGKIGTKVIPNYVVYPTPSVKSFMTDKASGQNINTAIKLTAAGAGGKTPYLYKFYYKLGTVTTTIQDFSATATATFKPTKVGTYTLYVDVKDAGGKVATKSIANYTVVNNPVVKTFTTDKATGQYVNTAINLNATGTAGTPAYQYKFYYKLGTTTVVLKDFSAANMATFKPTTAGTYTLYIQIKDAAGKIGTKVIPNYVVYSTPSVKSFTTDKASGQTINTAINLTAAGVGGKTPYLYKFYYKLGTVTTVIRDFSGTPTSVFKPTKAGTYTLYVDVKDAGGKISTKSIANYVIK